MKIAYVFASAFFIALGVIVFGEAGIISAFKLSQENARFEQRIQKLEAENEHKRQEIDAIQKDPYHLERTIRTNLSLVASDELVFEFTK